MAPKRRRSKVGLGRMDAALDAMRPMGFPSDAVRKSVKKLLKVYGDEGWVFIEGDAYRLLIETIIEEPEGDQLEHETGLPPLESCSKGSHENKEATYAMMNMKSHFPLSKVVQKGVTSILHLATNSVIKRLAMIIMKSHPVPCRFLVREYMAKMSLNLDEKRWRDKIWVLRMSKARKRLGERLVLLQTTTPRR